MQDKAILLERRLIGFEIQKRKEAIEFCLEILAVHKSRNYAKKDSFLLMNAVSKIDDGFGNSDGGTVHTFLFASYNWAMVAKNHLWLIIGGQLKLMDGKKSNLDELVICPLRKSIEVLNDVSEQIKPENPDSQHTSNNQTK